MFLLSQKPQIKIPNDSFVDRDVIQLNDGFPDLCDYYLKHESKRDAIAITGKKHLMRSRTDVARVESILQKTN